MNIQPVILGDLSSAYRLGPCPIKNKKDWTEKSANAIKHFINLIESIQSEKWIESPTSLSMCGEKIIAHFSPTKEVIKSFLLSMRQLAVSKDEVCNKACNYYIRHISDVVKCHWVQNEKNSFNKRRKSKLFPFDMDDYTNEDILRLIAYGTKMFHSESEEEKFSYDAYKKLEEKYGREKLHFTFNQSCNIVFDPMQNIYYLMRQDYNYWTERQECIPSKIENVIIG